MTRLLLILVAAVSLAACGIHEGHDEIKVIDGQRVVCSWTENKLSHNVSNYQCFPEAKP